MKKLLFAVMALLPTLALANPGAYIQGQLGVGGSVPLFLGAAGGVNGGYLWGNKNLNYGLEAGITGNPTQEQQFLDMSFSEYELSLLGVIKYTFDSGFIALAKAGVGYTTLTVSDPYGIGSASQSVVGPEVAIGTGYQFNANWELDLTADTTLYLQPSNSGPYCEHVLLGLTYHFA